MQSSEDVRGFGGTSPTLGLVQAPTPLHRLATLGRAWDHADLWVKREDLTAAGYGGNKVRNLDHLLGDARARGADTLVTVAPLGSNFVAALAAHAPRAGFTVDVRHFVPARTPQITAHAAFSRASGASLRVYCDTERVQPVLARTLGVLAATGATARSASRRGAYFTAPGGSCVVGAMGHVRAAFELAAQIERGDAPCPDAVVVGAGTCGTMAGLLVGLRLAGLGSVRLVGVRCVDRVVCNKWRVAGLANSLLERLLGRQRSFPLAASDVDLRDPPGAGPYGDAHPRGDDLVEELRSLEGLALDTTYTTKVVAGLRDLLRHELKDRRVLYWHTYGGAALLH